MEILFLLALLAAGGVTTAIYRNPQARAVAGGAWQAGRDRAMEEGRHGWQVSRARYQTAQDYLRRPTTYPDGSVEPVGAHNLRWWISAALAITAGTGTAAAGAAYAGGCAAAAGGRIVKDAVQGGREALQRQREAAKPVDGVVVEDVHVQRPASPQPGEGRQCDTCPSRAAVPRSDVTPDGLYCQECHGRRRAWEAEHGPTSKTNPVEFIPCGYCGTRRHPADLDNVAFKYGEHPLTPPVRACANCLSRSKVQRPRWHSDGDPTYESDTWPRPVSTPSTPAPGPGAGSTQTDGSGDSMIDGAGDKMSHGQLKTSVDRVRKHLAQGAAELDTVIASLKADEVSTGTINALRQLQEQLGQASAQAANVGTEVKKTDTVAEAINAVGAQNVAKKEHYADA